MNTIESLGYLKGLIDGLDLDPNKKETKVFKAVTAVIESMTKDIAHIYGEIDEVYELIDDINVDLCEVRETISGEEDECGDCDFSDDEAYEMQCPICGAPVYIDEDTDFESGVECPSCGEILKIEADDEDDMPNDKN